MTRTFYRTTLRPAGFGGLPPGVSYEYAEAPTMPGLCGNLNIPTSRYRYGVVRLSRELTPEEMEHFDIVLVEV
jgi:hypothetical protein